MLAMLTNGNSTKATVKNAEKTTDPAAKKVTAGSTVCSGDTTTKASTATTSMRTSTALAGNKTFVFLGSSVTYGSGGWSMCDYLIEYHDCTVIKWAVSGTTLVDNGAQSYVQRLLRSIDTQEVCDHFVCQLSTNDAGQKKPLGTISDSFDKSTFDTSTVIGAMEWIIATAKEKWNCSISFYTGTKFNSSRYQSMVDATLQLKEKWGIGVLDLWNDAEMNAVSTADYSRYMSDPVHPNRVGYEEWWGPKFAMYLLSGR